MIEFQSGGIGHIVMKSCGQKGEHIADGGIDHDFGGAVWLSLCPFQFLDNQAIWYRLRPSGRGRHDSQKCKEKPDTEYVAHGREYEKIRRSDREKDFIPPGHRALCSRLSGG